MLHVLFYAFFKTGGEPLHLLKVHPKLIFRGVLKKVLMVPENRSYQPQYFTKIFPSPLALMLHIFLPLYFYESAQNAL